MSPGGNSADGADGVSIPVGATVLLQPTGDADPLAFVSQWDADQPDLLGVTVDRSIQLFLADWRASTDATPADAALVGVGETVRSAASSGDCPSGGPALRTVADPANLDAVEAHVRSLLDGWRDREGPTVVVVDSATGLLDVAPRSDVLGFVEGLADLVAGADAVGFLAVRCPADPALDVVRRACDDVIEPTSAGWHLVESGGSDGRAKLPADEAYALLADARRRGVLRYLADRERTSVEELADALADGTDSDERTRLAGSLAHVHLPRLADAGVVEYDADAGVVAPTGAVECLLSMADVIESRE